MERDALFQMCMKQGEEALEELEVPIGCVFYHTGLQRVVAESRNSVNATKNATRHAELNCIDQALEFCARGNLSLTEFWPKIDVYVTCEPCIMCTRVLRHLMVKDIFYGCSNDRFGGCKSVFNVAKVEGIDEPALAFNPGIREEEAILLLKRFYELENSNAPPEKRKFKKRKRRMPS